jgi:flagellar motor switch protein FliM
MRKILSQAELDSLLQSARTIDSAASRADGGVTPYNFRRPDRVSKDEMRSLHFLHERFARNVTTSLAAYLRTTTELSLVTIEQFSYSEFLMALPDPTAFYAIAMPPFDVLGALELNPSVAFTIVDRLLGGGGRTGSLERALTEIELNIIDAIVKLFLEQLSETWRQVADLRFHIQGRETRPQMLHVTGRNEVVIMLVFDLKVGDIRGVLHFCIPATVVEGTGASFAQGFQKKRREPTSHEQRWLTENLGSVPLPVTAMLETGFTAREMLGLAPGHVLNLGVPLRSPVEVKVGQIVKFRGRLTARGRDAAVSVEQTCGRPAEGLVVS